MNISMRANCWLIGFMPSANRGPFRWLGGRQHVFACRRDEWTGRWLVVEHSIAGLAVRLVEEDKAIAMTDYAKRTCGLLMMPARRREVSLIAPPLQTCVSVVKALVGVQSWWTITPRGLRRLLLKRGAIDLAGDA